MKIVEINVNMSKRGSKRKRSARLNAKSKAQKLSYDELPKKTLLKILSYLPSRRYAALVNKDWYTAACEIDNAEGIYKLNFDGTDDKNFDDIINSIVSSKREVTEADISNVLFLDPDKACAVQRILVKFCATLRNLTLHKCIITDDELCKLLRLIPDIEKFSFITSRIKRCNKTKLDFSMTCLKKVDFSGSFWFPRTTVAPYDLMSDLIEMFAMKSPLKSFSAVEHIAQVFPIDQSKLKHLKLELAKPKHMRIADIVQRQYQLKSLDLLDCFIMDDVMECLSLNLKKLKVLKINISGMSPKGFALISELHLKGLHIKAGKAPWISNALSPLRLSTVEELYMNLDELEISDRIFAPMFASVWKLKTLHIKTNSVAIIDVIFQSCCSLREGLMSCTIEFSNLHLLKHLPQCKPKLNELCELRELTIINTDQKFAQKIMFNFLKSFVRLQKLTLRGFRIDEHLFENALQNHYGLEYLELREVKEKNVKFILNNSIVSSFYEFGCKLKVIKVECLSFALLREYTMHQFPIVERQGLMQVLRHR